MAKWYGSVSECVQVEIDRVWEIAEFGNLARWDSSIEGSEMVWGDGSSEGSVRCVTFRYSDGSTGSLYERITSFSSCDYSYTYALDENPFGYENYESTIALHSFGDGRTLFTWSFELDPMDSYDRDSVVAHIENVFQRRISLIEEAACN